MPKPPTHDSDRSDADKRGGRREPRDSWGDDRNLAGPRAAVWGMLGAILLLGLVLRCWQIGEPLWVDELHTAWTVMDGLESVPARATMGNQSPLYFLLPWLSTRIFGPAEWALRLPSVIGGTLLMALMFLAVRRWSGSNSAGLLAAALIAVDRTCLFYATEARSFAWVQVAAVAHWMIFDRLLTQPDWRRRGMMILLGGVLIHLHYTAALMLVAESVWYAVVWVTRPSLRYSPRAALVDALGIAAIAAMALPHLAEIAQRRENWAFVGTPDLLAPLSVAPLDVYVLIPCIAAAFYLTVGRWLGFNVPRWNDARQVGLPACWYFVPVLIAWSLTRSEIARVFFLRYLVASYLAPIAFAAMCLPRFNGWLPRGAVAAALLLGSIHSGGMVAQWSADGQLLDDRREDWRGAVSYLNTSPQCTDCPVLIYAGLIEVEDYLARDKPLARQYGTLPFRGIYRLEDDAGRLFASPGFRAPFDSEFVEAARAAGGVWLVSRFSEQRAPGWEAAVLGSLRGEGLRAVIVERRGFGDVTVTLCRW